MQASSLGVHRSENGPSFLVHKEVSDFLRGLYLLARMVLLDMIKKIQVCEKA